MSAKTRIKRAFGGLAVVLSILVIGYLFIRPIHLRWGATDEEVAQAMPGDLDGSSWTRAITINATPEQIWPWLLQWGQGRGGWYSYDWLENLFGFDIHTANRILPEFQDLAVGDPICMAPEFCTSSISVIEPYRWLGWETLGEDGASVWTFMMGLAPVDATHTRFIIRESFSARSMPAAAVVAIEIPDVVMEQKALATVKDRAEGRSASARVTGVEISVWLAALAMGVAAGVLMLTRLDWQRPLLLGSASVIVLLVLTFLFPPLWLRVVLDLFLGAGMVWVWQSSPLEMKLSVAGQPA